MPNANAVIICHGAKWDRVSHCAPSGGA